jgi:glycine amidinotransferase
VAREWPRRHDFSTPLRTPTFEVPNQYCSVCPRDVMITLGDEIVEATMSHRGRYFESRHIGI